MNINQLKKIHPQYTSCQYVSEIFTGACINNDHEVISYLLKNCPKHDFFIDGFFHCMSNGKFVMSKYIYELSNYNFFLHFTGQEINIILKNSINNLELTEWTYNLVVDKSVIDVDKLFRSAIDVNNISAIKWILYIWPDTNKKTTGYGLIDPIVKHNDVKLLQFVINIFSSYFFERFYTFIDSIMTCGHVELLQWLIENYPTYMLTGDKFNPKIILPGSLIDHICGNYYIDLLEFMTPLVNQIDLQKLVNYCYEYQLVDQVYHIIRCHDITDGVRLVLRDEYTRRFADDVELVNTSVTKSARKI